MIKSMTGYGSAKGTVEGIEVCVELKSVNNKFLDTSVRLPRSFLFAEETIKSAVMSHITRGKVDVFVTVDSSMADDMVVKVNEPLLKGYIDALRHIAEENDLPNDITAMSVSRFPDVLNVEKRSLMPKRSPPAFVISPNKPCATLMQCVSERVRSSKRMCSQSLKRLRSSSP